jgi:hypothetical protein
LVALLRRIGEPAGRLAGFFYVGACDQQYEADRREDQDQGTLKVTPASCRPVTESAPNGHSWGPCRSGSWIAVWPMSRVAIDGKRWI